MPEPVGNQLPILLIDFCIRFHRRRAVGNQLPILLIDFPRTRFARTCGWESVTNPLDRLHGVLDADDAALGISYQSS